MGCVQSTCDRTNIKGIRTKSFTVKNDNGYIFNKSYCEPEKLLSIILSYIEPDDLVFNCRRVCKAWCNVIDTHVWKLKCQKNDYDVEIIQKLPWYAYYWIFKKKVLQGRNFIKNGCGQENLEHWDIHRFWGSNFESGWKVDKVSVESDFPREMDDEITKYNSCFSTPYEYCKKEQVIDLAAEGVAGELLDLLQPEIIVSEWFSGREDYPSSGSLSVTLLSEDRRRLAYEYISQPIIHQSESSYSPTWRKLTFAFRNYGEGVRYISYRNRGHSGTKMTGASLVLQMPKIRKATKEITIRQPYKLMNDNGYIFNEAYSMPEELLATILSYIEPKDLIFNCRKVCKAWCNIIDTQVWKIKFQKKNVYIQKISTTPWFASYSLVTGKKFWNLNLIKNGCGQGKLNYWGILSRGGNGWRIEKPPHGCEDFPLEIDDDVIRHNSCFATSFAECVKEQIIDLSAEGASPALMDFFQPNIEISEWYSGRRDCPSSHTLQISLCDENQISFNSEILSFRACNRIGLEHGSDWHKVTHVFKNYGPGVRYIRYRHSGKDLRCWKGLYGCKMTGASVVLKKPDCFVEF